MISPTVTPTLRNTLFTTIPSAGGIPYTDFGRVLDYSTQVGPFTIVDKSGEGNTATLYSGRGLTMDGVGDLIDFGSPTFSEPVTSMTGYARSTDTSINLGLTSATLAGNDTWETFSADTPAKDYGDAQWFNGVDTAVTLGANAMFAIQPTDSFAISFSALLTQSVTRNSIIGWRTSATGSVGWILRTEPTTGVIRFFIYDNSSFTECIGTTDICDSVIHDVSVSHNGAGSFAVTIDGSPETLASSQNNATAVTYSTLQAYLGAIETSSGVTERVDGLLYSIDYVKNATHAAYTGLSPTPWTDTIGSNDGTPSGTFVTAAQHFTNPDFILGTGYNGDLSDVRCLGATGTVLGHWSLADWSNPSGNTSNGKTVVDSGPNQLHGTCTGCSGFTGEGIDPEFAGIVGYDDKMWFDGVDDSVTPTSAFTLAVGEFAEIVGLSSTGSNVSIRSNEVSGHDFFNITEVSLRLRVGSVIYEHTGTPAAGLNTCRVLRSGASEFTLTLNGVAEVFATASGSFTVDDFMFGGGSFYASGLLLSVNYNDASMWTNTGSTAADWEDDIGSNDCTVSGDPLTVGQKRATIPQTADKNWNKYQWFNGTDTHIAIAHSTDFNRGGAELRVSGRFTSMGISAIIFDKRTVLGGNTSGFFVGINANGSVTSKVYQGNSSNGDAVVSSSTYDDGLPHQFELVINNSTISIAVDGSDIDSTANTGDVADSANDLFFGKNTNPSSLSYLAGTVWDIDWSVAGVSKASYTGLGNDPWADTIGSNDGTEAGTFTRELVSASDANDQIDALGTAILEPRLNTQQLNLFGEGEYSSTPDSASLDVTTAATWEVWGNFYGVPATSYSVLSKYDTGSQRSWWVGKSSLDLATEFKMQTSVDGLAATTLVMGGLSDKVSQLVVTFSSGTLLAYVDGVAVTVTGTSGSSLFNSSAPVMIGTLKASGVNALLSNNKIGSAKIYNVALTADEVLTNYNTQKSLYVTNGAAFSAEAQNYFDRLDVANDTTYIPYKQPLANYIDGLVTLGGAYWDTMKSAASFVGVGIEGITVPLRDGMTAITNNNFVTGDLDQLTGLKSGVAGKYLDTGTIGSDYEQNDCSMSAYMTSTTSWTKYIMGVVGFDAGAFAIMAKSGEVWARMMTGTQRVLDGDAATFTGFVGASRTTSTGFDGRANSITTPQTATSQTPQTAEMSVFTTSGNSNTTDARLATYHVGPALNLATLEGLQATLISEIAAI